MSTPSGQLYIGFYVGGSLVGNSVYIGGSPTNIYGFDPTNTSTYQLVSIPITAFGVLPTTVDAIRFFKGPGSTTAEFFLDGVEIQEGAVAPPVAPSLPSLTEDHVWIGDPTNTAVEVLLSSLLPPSICGNPLVDLFPGDSLAVCRWNGSSFDVFSIDPISQFPGFAVIDIDPGVGFTWGTAQVLAGFADSLKLVAGNNITIAQMQ
jgi:hypothetical protein